MTVLEIESLSRRFGRTHAVRDLSLRVGAGQVFGLLGPNGSGKTTTLACALGWLRPSAGRVRILGEDPRRVARAGGRIGVVSDLDAHLPRLTARQNLEHARRLGPARGGRDAGELLERVGLTELAGRRAGRMSLGERKRLAIARALLGEPELLVLDEPLSGLDPLAVRSMLALIGELRAEGRTMVVSSHRLHEMQGVVTHAGILLRGRLARAGSLAELLGAGPPRYRLRAAPVERARARLAAMPGLSLANGEQEGELLLEWRDPQAAPAPAELNRLLVAEGLEVSVLAPLEASLAELFERLADAAAAAPPGERGAA